MTNETASLNDKLMTILADCGNDIETYKKSNYVFKKNTLDSAITCISNEITSDDGSLNVELAYLIGIVLT